MADYASFKVLLDDPAEQPALGFPGYAQAFAEIIEHSEPQFAIGVFGDWGSGKTTLMRAIGRRFADSESVVTVWFNAWRYEREEHLIVPMLDTLREALVEWAAKRPDDPSGVSRARVAAMKVGRAARALLAGFSLRASVPLGIGDVEASFDPAKVMESFGDHDGLADDPSSFYHASFRAMRDAIAEFVEGGVRRVVVFIDDLDRCLPLNALEVLESIKLFFDLEGFVFVVGLDQAVIERSIELKYQSPSTGSATLGAGDDRTPASEERRPPISGADYVKKIFQVPFGLPRIATDQIEEFFDHLVTHGDLPPEQTANYREVVRPHLEHLSGEAAVNPREVKRLLNAYALQLKMLSAKALPGGLRPEVVVALQTIGFRADWRRLYDQLAADPELFVRELRDVVDAGADAAGQDFWLSGEPLPFAFINYVRGTARPLLEVPLEPYLSSAESTRSSQPGLLAAQSDVGQILRLLDEVDEGGAGLGSEVVSQLHGRLERMNAEIRHMESMPAGAQALSAVQRLQSTVSRLGDPELNESDQIRNIVEDMRALLREIGENLRELRRQTSVGATPS